MNYFGTDLRQAGHYFWYLQDERMDRSGVYFEDIPFDPYDGQKQLPKGTVTFKNEGDFSALIISGSCTDGRNGTVSTFFLKEKLTQDEMKEKILSIPIGKKIIEQMKFNVKW